MDIFPPFYFCLLEEIIILSNIITDIHEAAEQKVPNNSYTQVSPIGRNYIEKNLVKKFENKSANV